MAGIQGENSALKGNALGVNNSNILANGSSSRKGNMLGGDLNNTSTIEATSTKKIGNNR